MRSEDGFTLIELLVVIFIMGLLLVVVGLVTEGGEELEQKGLTSRQALEEMAQNIDTIYEETGDFPQLSQLEELDPDIAEKLDKQGIDVTLEPNDEGYVLAADFIVDTTIGDSLKGSFKIIQEGGGLDLRCDGDEGIGCEDGQWTTNLPEEQLIILPIPVGR